MATLGLELTSYGFDGNIIERLGVGSKAIILSRERIYFYHTECFMNTYHIIFDFS